MSSNPHEEKQSIFDEYAKSQEYKDWKSLEFEFEIFLMSADEFMLHVFSACDLVQKEQQKRIAENAETIPVYPEKDDLDSEPLDYVLSFIVNKESITSPDNLIK